MYAFLFYYFFFFFQAEDGIRDGTVTGVQTCALPISFVAGNRSPSSFVLVLPGSRSRPVDRLRESGRLDRKSTRLNSSHSSISYAVFCLKKKRVKLDSILSHYSRLNYNTTCFISS